MTTRTRRTTTRIALLLGAAAALGWGCDDNSRSVDDAITLDTSSDLTLPDGVDPDAVDPDATDPDVQPDEIGPDVPPDVPPDGTDPCAGVSSCATERASCTGDTLDLCQRNSAGCLVLSSVDCAANGATCDDADGSGTCVGATTEFVCNDGEDDDADGLVDCDDPDCTSSPVCGQCLPDGQPSADPLLCCSLDPDQNGICGDQGGAAEVCQNAQDDDGDGATDCNDTDCANDAACTGEQCTDRQDNDFDGDIDCDDADCANDAVACPPCIADGDFATNPNECCSGDPDQNLICGDQGGMCLGVGEQCTPGQTGECCQDPCKDGMPVGFPGGGFCCAPDGADYLNQSPVPDPYVCCNGDADGNGLCGGTALGEDCANGADDDNDGQVDCADADCAGSNLCLSGENCTDGADNDGDNFADCLDPDCTGDPACPCIADGQAAVDPSQCCNGDADQNFVCGDQGGMCSGPGQQCDPSQTGECCIEPCKDTAPLGFPGFGFCCVPDGVNYVEQSPVPDPYVCCNGDADMNGICGASASGEVCGNGADDDGDGLVDCADSSCSNAPGCVEDCQNGQDDDGDMRADCNDTDCSGDPACQQCLPDGQPTNDPNQCCSGDPDQNFVCGDQGGMCGGPGSFCDPTQTGECCQEPCKDGAQIGIPGIGFCCAPDGTDYQNQSPVPDPYVCCNGDSNMDGLCGGGGGGTENCSNGQDDDGDGQVDCADASCANDPACAQCLPDGDFTLDPSQCCNGDPDGNFTCGDQGNTMCRQPATTCGLGVGQCCVPQTCRNGNAVGTPGQRFCCIPAGQPYGTATAPYNQEAACCGGDQNNDGTCD